MRAANMLGFVGALFFVGFIHNVVTGEAQPGDTIAQLSVIALCLGAFLFLQRELRLRAEFLAYLRDNVAAVRDGSAQFHDQPVSYATQVRTYEVVLSFLVASVKLPTRFVIHREGADLGLRVGCSVVTLLFGWWGIPWGPFWTVGALVRNGRGGTRTTVGQLLEGEPCVALAPATSRS